MTIKKGIKNIQELINYNKNGSVVLIEQQSNLYLLFTNHNYVPQSWLHFTTSIPNKIKTKKKEFSVDRDASYPWNLTPETRLPSQKEKEKKKKTIKKYRINRVLLFDRTR